MGILYIVPTPIGNLKDVTLRAIEVLFSVDVIACEDTRKTGLLLSKLSEQNQSRPRLLSYYEQNEQQRIPEIVSMVKDGLDVALVSDAGTPAISDPGFKLIRECIKESIKVESLPGASSVITALASSGLPTDKFSFLGYPPRKPGHRITFFENIRAAQEFIKSTIIIFEAPHKVVKTTTEMQEVFGDIDIVLVRELTKIHEEIRREKTSSALTHFKKVQPKGEFVILFNLTNK